MGDVSGARYAAERMSGVVLGDGVFGGGAIVSFFCLFVYILIVLYGVGWTGYVLCKL